MKAEDVEIESWSDIVPTLVRIPLNAYKHRFVIQKWWKRLLVYINQGDTNIVVLGRSNVGKSVMVSYLYGETNNLTWELPDTSDDVESKALTLEKWTHIVRVIPGQTGDERYQGLREAFQTSNNLDGLIYVADFGWTNLRDKTITRKLIQEDKIDTIEKLRKENLQRELEDFKLIAEKLKEAYSNGRGIKWLLIVVNKADLFFEQNLLEDAEEYYHLEGNSDFSKLLRSTINHIGSSNIKFASIPLCSFEKDFVWNNETKATSIGEEDNRKALMKNFFRTVAKFYR